MVFTIRHKRRAARTRRKAVGGCVIIFLSPNWFRSSIVHSVLNLKVALSIMCAAYSFCKTRFNDFKLVGLAGKR